MRIAINSGALVDLVPCGTKTFLQEIISRWVTHWPDRAQVTIVVPDAAGQERVGSLLAASPWTAAVVAMSRWPRRMRWLMGGGSITPQIGSHDVYLSGWHWPLGRLDRPFVGIVHDLAPLQEPAGGASLKRRCYRLLYRRSLLACCRRADAIVCVSRYTLEQLQRLCPASSATRRVIPLGVDVQKWQTRLSDDQTAAALNRCGLKPGSRYVLGLGRHVPNKNFATLVEAFHRVVAGELKDVELVLAGGFASETAALQRYVNEHDLAGRVQMPGFVSEMELRALMQNAAVFAFPSLMEGFGIPVLEAFAAGTPVVCSNAGSLPEVAGDAALTVGPADVNALGAAIRRVLSEPHLRQELIGRGSRQARAYTWESCADAYLDLFEQICAAQRVLMKQ